MRLSSMAGESDGSGVVVGDEEWERRFGGVGRLYGRAAGTLARRRVMVVGIGGVGTWVVESLARSGVGSLALVDADDICVTNTNRQLHAVEESFGEPKAAAMARRVRSIHPGCRVEVVGEFLSAGNVARLLEPEPDVVVDAIDAVAAKAVLAAHCVRNGVRMVCCGAAGGRRDPFALKRADLGRSGGDPLLRRLRRVLRRDFDVERNESGEFGISCVFSAEPQWFARADGTVCGEPEPGASTRLDCSAGLGTAAHVTGCFGLAAAALALEMLVGVE